MTYTVEQHKGNSIYVYQVESFWDTDKQQPRQRRVYLGKKAAPRGRSSPSGLRQFTFPRWSQDYGHMHLLTQLARRLGLPEMLQQVFPDQADLLLLLAMYEVIEERPLYLFSAWAEDVVHPVKALPSTPQLSGVLQELGRAERRREAFSQHWIQRHAGADAVLYDITSVSSHSRFIDLCEWGYNRDGEALPQINLGLVWRSPGRCRSPIASIRVASRIVRPSPTPSTICRV